MADDAARSRGTPARLSPSALNRWRRCPRQWWFRYIQGLSDPPSRAGVLGTVTHRTLELLFELAPAKRSVREAAGLVGVAWDEALVDEKGELESLWLTAQEQAELHLDVLVAVHELLSHEDPVTVDVLGLEEHFVVELDGVPVAGVIDRIERRHGWAAVTDYKTGKRPKRPDFRQLLIYAAAWKAVRGEQVGEVRYLYREGFDGGRIRSSSTDGVLVELRRVWNELKVAVATDDFPERTSALCGWCAYVDRCEQGQRFVRTVLARSRPDAPAFALLRPDPFA